ncbi:MAG: PKD domain-containing protein [Bacteroidetes bacterium]|nr:PKD domain-containing protein [Bacteroidota bacterium]
MKTLSAFTLNVCISILLAFICVKARGQLNADFTSSTPTGCSPLFVQFTNTSTGSITDYLWDLGNGNTSTEKNPAAIYSKPGTYSVKLYIKGGSGEDSIIKTNYVTVYENPVINFSAQPESGCVPLTVQFTDNSTAGSGSINQWIWDFGDGITSTDKNPSHTYFISDTFSVTLTTINSFGCKNTLQQEDLIKVGDVILDSFTYSYVSACKPPVAVTFNNLSQSNSDLTFFWDFGDGNTSTAKNPVHTYSSSGDFNVKLVATNANGCNQTYEEKILIGSANADFTFANACINSPTIFIDNSNPKSLTQKWFFGDGTSGSGSQVSHVYTASGTYQVTLYADFGGCKDTITKPVTTGQKINADFTASGNTNTCLYPTNIQFASDAPGAITYLWLFGDGTRSTDANPLHAYNSPGQYVVTLIAYSSTGCPDTVIKNNFIRIGPPKITGIKGLPYEGCAPKTLTLTPVINTGASIATYKWDFGDGSTSTDSIPIHTFSNPGVYDISLVVSTSEGCKDSIFLPSAVTLGEKPKPDFVADPLNGCADTTIQFTDKSTGAITSWYWEFGDGSSSSEQNPSHKYSDTGYMNITLIVGQYGCYDTLNVSDYIYVKPPVALFSTSVQCSDPFTYTFTDKSIAAETWHWDFGDGKTSDKKDETHKYNSKGIFKIALTVTNGACSYTNYDSINVVQENPSFKFAAVSTNFCKYDSIKFTATNYNSDNIKTFQWDFGDGIYTNASSQNDVVYHIYNNAQTYKPLLITRDVNNCPDTVNKNIEVQVFGPDAAFGNVEGDCIFSTITFNDASTTDGTHAITKWIWNYGDGSAPDTLTTAPFMHTYNQKGLYDVQLKIFDDNGCYDKITKYEAVQITKPVADFTTADTIMCSGNDVQFVDASAGVSLVYNWDFGDGKSSADASPLHSYSGEGDYNIQLSLKDKYGCTDTIIKTQYVHVANPVAGFDLADSLFLCPPAKIDPVNTSLNYTALTWDFGDGNTSTEIAPEHYYTTPGNFNLQLIAKGYGNCYDTLTKPFVLKGPFATLSYLPITGCNPLNVTFTAKAKNTTGFIWDYGDGVAHISSDSNAAYEYVKPGKFLPQLVVVDSGGCRVPVVNPDTIVVYGVDAKYAANRVQGVCDSTLYDFIDSSQALYDEVLSYNWKFGDGDSSILKTPSHYYSVPSTYKTTLQVLTKNGCENSFALPLDVSIDSTVQILADIPDNACVNALVPFSARPVSNLSDSLIWQWDLGDGMTSNSKDTLHSFAAANTYNVFVTATTTAGCVDTVSKQLRIDPLPVLDAGIDSFICLGQSITLNATGASAYSWMDDATLSCTNCSDPVATPKANTTYYLNGKNNFGCSADDSVFISVKQPANVFLTAPDTICVGTTIRLSATGAELYDWQPASSVSSSTDSVTSSTPLATTLFTVIGKDSKGCFSDTASATVHVFPYPLLKISDSVVTVSAGDEYKVNLQSSPDVIAWQWYPLNDLSCTLCPQPVIKPMRDITYTVTAKNIAGCSAEQHITITVLCKDQNLFIPNTFSPNGDGMNDYFYPRGKGLFVIKSFRIFNRWGSLIFQENNFPPNQRSYGWNGKYKGNVLPPDVYVYVIEVMCSNGVVLSSKGNVTLLR